MNNKLKSELLGHLIDTVNYLSDGINYSDELHQVAFNEDYYIVGYYQASEWLKGHNIDAFEAISTVIEWEENVLGEVTLKASDINSEKVVNLYVYILGEELLQGFDLELNKSELLKELKEAWKELN